ncbi:polyphosphate kinase 1 [Aureispira anguillae]|uniref:Polyphosphate kinase n=1 Tax=Aureispira anguillae TaxID=2864201 RepID=A0A916DVJ3_9BACT|nr:polyphosphate kinase 1 [Aureispira anguillae]BDS13630.1 polyphosphate kinase 1 [Aureispira anguillae]
MFRKKNIPFIHRDISWLSFNYRVLQEAKDKSVPLFERIKFLGIYSSNLDEFFRVRVAALKALIRLGKKTKNQMDFSPELVLKRIRKIVTDQQVEFDNIYKNQILPELGQNNIYILRPKDLKSYHHLFLDRLFEERLIQHLQPILLVKNKIRTFLPSNAIYLAVRLKTAGHINRYAVVKIPSDKFSRFIELPSRDSKRKEIIILDDIIRYCLPRLFPGYAIRDAYSIKMTRDADIYIEDEYTGDLIEKIRKGIAKRTIGPGTRFVYDRRMSKRTLNFLTAALQVKEGDLQAEGRYHNNYDFFKFPNFGLKKLRDISLPPLSHKDLHQQQKLFSVIDEKDHLLHYPYQKYDYVIRLLEQAAHDPEVTSIKIAQYRVAKDSQVIAALRSAIQEGKDVMVFMEVKARFDEEANLYWAERLESWGAKVMYSLPELKVHAKLLLITRKSKRYAYLGTGNFNEDTSKIYSDFGLMTADKRLTKEVEQIFDFLEFYKRPEKNFKHLLVGQFRMRRNIYQLIEQEIENAKAGKKAVITLKLNSIQDARMIARLYDASNAGVKIRMIIRGVCSVVPGQVGYSENIEIISIVDRFLEHTRIYMFHNDGDEKIYLSSADWMTRNLFYRIECAFPIYAKDLKQEIKDFLDIQFKDNVKARIINAKQDNQYKKNNSSPKRSQYDMYVYYQDKLLPKIDK